MNDQRVKTTRQWLRSLSKLRMNSTATRIIEKHTRTVALMAQPETASLGQNHCFWIDTIRVSPMLLLNPLLFLG